MTHVHNGEHGFKDEFLDGLVTAYGRYLRRVPGASAVMSVDAPAEGQVSVIIGGGSGHYPAFAGLVGPGLCHAAVVGDIFTSPSSEQAYQAIRALDGGAGVLISFGNYAGDVMHFGLAAERARAEGVDSRTVLVTDDVASAPADHVSARRGIAGGFWVFRAAATAARQGRSLDEVEWAARHANERTFTFGVAFAGCTFPGRETPLFSVEQGRMAVGLGIHGEPGVALVEWQPAAQLAVTLTDRLLAERPADGRRARVLLNGLGSTKYEELFVLFRSVHERLRLADVEVVDPEVGEFVTSLDMAGCSLTLCWADEQLDGLLSAPATAPGFRSGGTPAAPAAIRSGRPGRDSDAAQRGEAARAAGPAGAAALAARGALDAIADAIAGVEGELGRLDSVAGDGDHGAGMVRGTRAAARASASAGPDVWNVLHAAGVAFSDAAGGASGALWGAALIACGAALRARLRPGETPDQEALHAGLVAAREAVASLGGAQVGDKTLMDGLEPFVDAFGRAPGPLARAWRDAAGVALEAALATAGLAGRRGRAALHAERSVGTPDPGAVSLAIALQAAADALAASCPASGDADAGTSSTAPAGA